MNKKPKVEDEIKQLALEHWEYVESISKKMYIDAFIHGHKHGVDIHKSIVAIFEKMKK